MERFDQEIKNMMVQELEETVLSSPSKVKIREAMHSELSHTRQNPLRRICAKVEFFWESTHEVSLAPLAALTCVVLVVAVSGLWRVAAPESKEAGQPMYFISQSEGGMEVLPLSDGEEGYLNDNARER